MMEDNFNSYFNEEATAERKHSRAIRFGVTIILIVIIIAIILIVKYSIESRYSTVKLTYTPTTATVTIDNKTYEAGAIQLLPGKHELVIQKYGFETQTKVFETYSGKTTSINIILSPNASFTEDWYEHNQNDSTVAEGIASRESDQARIDTLEEYPVFNDLPVKEKNFYIYQATCNQNRICIMIDSGLPYMNDAIKYLRNIMKIDLGKYYITFKNYVNPFKGEG